MFARFRNLFSKNKTDSAEEREADLAAAIVAEDAETSTNTNTAHEGSPKLEGLSFLKSLVESEQQNSTESVAENTPHSLSEEQSELLQNRVLKNEENPKINQEQIRKDPVKYDIKFYKENVNLKAIEEIYDDRLATDLTAHSENVDSLNKRYAEFAIDEKALENSLEKKQQPEIIKTETELIQQNETKSDYETSFSIDTIDPKPKETFTPVHLTELDTRCDYNNISPSSGVTLVKNSPQIHESSQSLAQSTANKNNANSTVASFEHFSLTNPCDNSSIVVEDLPSEIATPSPTVESTISGSSSNTSTLESACMNEVTDPSKIVINPINNNGLACCAITNKLSDIAEVAESLDAVIRDVQENVQLVEVEPNANSSHKKLGTLRSTSSEDWHSRSTEEDSFATASEGNFTPSSSSFQTASGRTSSFISCDKNSYDASEADDSTFAFDMPELTSPLNMSFEGSEQSYLSAQPLNNLIGQEKQKVPTKLSVAANFPEEDLNSTADIEELHSESVTPTPEENYNACHIESIPIDSETELEVACIADAPSLEILTEHATMPMSRTPEVSASNSNISSNQNTITTEITGNLTRDSNDHQQEQQNSNSTNNNNIKPNAAWRRSKYYENITKQTIKGFL